MPKLSSEPRRVLVVDDDVEVLAVLMELLQEEGYEVFSASDGESASQLALSCDPDLVVSDVVMPVLDGIKLCRRLKKDFRTANIPVLLISGLRPSIDHGIEGLTAGADDYLDLPFRHEALLVKVARLTERHRIEKHYREIVEQAADIIYTHTLRGHIISINAAGARFFGRRAVELVGAHLRELLGTEAANQDIGKIKRLDTEVPCRSLHCLKNVQGETRYLDGVITVERNHRGEATGARGVLRDVTEQKLANEALRESEERYRQLVELSPEAIVVHIDGRLTYVNPAAQALWGAKSADELIGMRMLDLVHPDYRERVSERMRELHEKGTPTPLDHFKHIKLDGEVIDVEVTGMPFISQGNPAIQVVIRDVTERKRSREALKETETRLRTVIENAPVVLFSIDRDGLFTVLEGEGLKALGLKPGEIVGQSVYEVYKDNPQIINSVQRALEGAAFSTVVEVGELVYETRYAPLTNDKNEITGVIGVATDITENRKSEKASRQNEERYRELFENANDIIYTHDLSGNFTSLNRSGERIVGYSWDEAAHMNISDVIAPEYLETALEMIKRKAIGNASTVYELELITKQNRRVRLEVSSRVIYRDGRPVGVQGVARDLTEHKRSEAALRESQSFFHSFMDNSPAIAFMKDDEGRYVYVNKPFEGLFGP
ncbi:MAG: PAS domain S-box protein, partial [Acidobacteriota bacterium]